MPDNPTGGSTPQPVHGAPPAPTPPRPPAPTPPKPAGAVVPPHDAHVMPPPATGGPVEKPPVNPVKEHEREAVIEGARALHFEEEGDLRDVAISKDGETITATNGKNQHIVIPAENARKRAREMGLLPPESAADKPKK